MTDIEVRFSREAKKFLARNANVMSQKEAQDAVIAGVRKLISEQDSSIDLKRLHGSLEGLYRVRVGKVRIIFSVSYGIVHIASVSEIGFRGNVY